MVNRIGQGGRATVYRFRQVNVGRAVAVTVIKPELTDTAALLERFRRAAATMAWLSQAHLVNPVEDNLYKSAALDHDAVQPGYPPTLPTNEPGRSVVPRRRTRLLVGGIVLAVLLLAAGTPTVGLSAGRRTPTAVPASTTGT